MPFIPANFPDQVWAHLKAWAKVRASDEETPTIDDCASEVRRVSRDITGRADALRLEVVNFYAAETAEMVEKFREQLLGGISPGKQPHGPADVAGTGFEPAV